MGNRFKRSIKNFKRGGHGVAAIRSSREARSTASDAEKQLQNAAAAEEQATYGSLSDEMGRLGQSRATARQDAIAAAQRGGTYAQTPAFESSLESETGARDRGLREEYIRRINAIRRRLGMPDYNAPSTPVAAPVS